MRRLVAMALVLALPSALVVRAVFRATSRHSAHQSLAMLKQTYITVADTVPLELPALADVSGASFGTSRLRGHWSVIAFGFTSCPDVCPMTLQVLSDVARDSTSGVAAGTTQVVFISVDPARDTPDRMKRYLLPFDRHIVGLMGTRDAVMRFSAATGAAYERTATGIDHSTSLFVLDPEGRRAGILLRPANPARVIADLKTLQASYEARGWPARVALVPL